MSSASQAPFTLYGMYESCDCSCREGPIEPYPDTLLHVVLAAACRPCPELKVLVPASIEGGHRSPSRSLDLRGDGSRPGNDRVDVECGSDLLLVGFLLCCCYCLTRDAAPLHFHPRPFGGGGTGWGECLSLNDSNDSKRLNLQTCCTRIHIIRRHKMNAVCGRDFWALIRDGFQRLAEWRNLPDLDRIRSTKLLAPMQPRNQTLLLRPSELTQQQPRLNLRAMRHLL